MSTSTESIEGLVAQWQSIAAASRSGRGSGGLESAGAIQAPDPEECLVKMLRIAAQLEFATIPPYLCALWSIEDDRDPVAESIREVVQEEMLHLALVCNLLAAMGQQPEFCNWAPQYPGPLPGGVHQGLEVKLQGLTKEGLLDFIRIESPEMRADNVDAEQGDPYWKGGQTIGMLYDSILAAFRHLKPELKTDNQVTGPLSWRTVATLADVEWAVRIIQHQGEGAVIGPLDSSKEDLAHYYRFLEIWKGKRLKFDQEDRHFYWRGKVELPKCRPMGPVPLGGYKQPPDENVARRLKDFDLAYTQMLLKLENAWGRAAPDVATGQGALVAAYVEMFKLGKHARDLMNIPLTGDSKGLTYGPHFQLRYPRSSSPLAVASAAHSDG